MIANLNPYSNMRSSGVPWVGDFPNHWRMTPNRAMLSRRKVLVGKAFNEYTLLSLTKEGVIVRDISTARGKFSADMGTCQEVRRGDLVFCLFDVPETPRTVGLSPHDGMITGAYTVFECDDPVLARFLEAFYIAMDDRKLLRPLYSGLRNTIPPLRFLGTKTPVPTHVEQHAIVRFLDHADLRIRRYIRAKERLIELLEEQKQATIHQAVTGQIDVRTGQPYPAYMDSGVQWLGKVPEHWGVLPLKRAFASMEYGISDSGTDGGAIAVLTMGHIRDGKARVPKYGGVNTVVPSLLLQDKDLLFNRTNSAELVAKVGLFRSGERPATFASYLVRMRIHQRNKPEFLNLLLNDVAFLSTARREAIPSLHQSNLNPTRYWPLANCFTTRSEQQGIAELRCASDLDGAVARASREIDLRTNTVLIADVVTGKLDVREATAAMLEELDAPTDFS